MTDPLFLCALTDPLPAPGSTVVLDGPEGRHAVVVRRIRPGESMVLADGAGRGVTGVVSGVGRDSLTVTVREHRTSTEPAVAVTVAQALAKGDRGELAVEMLTEVGVRRILPWQAARSVVRWQGERGERAVERWRATAREAAKQSRRLRLPEVTAAVSTAELAAEVGAADLALILDADADQDLAGVPLPVAGTALLVVGPEGGIAPEELAALLDAGACAVRVNDGVLRTSTAGVVAVAALHASLLAAGRSFRG